MPSLQLDPRALERYGLPDIAYPVPAADLQTALANDGELPLAVLLQGLQQRSQAGDADWRALEPAMERLAELLAPNDGREAISAAGEDWWLEIGPVDLDGFVVTIQRGDALIAAVAAREDGRLRVAVCRPLDAKSTGYLIALGQVPHPTNGVGLRENNWQYALDCAAANGNVCAAERGEAYLSCWERGVGVSRDGTEVPEWRAQKDASSRPAAGVVAELGVHYALSGDDDASGEDDAVPVAEVDDAHEPDTPAPPAWRSKRQQRRTVRGRFLGCLLGGAVGDALGAPVEFMSRSEILRRFGPTGITMFAPAYGGLGAITDDTQMTLFTAEGLIRGWVRGCFKGITSFTTVTSHAYLRWLQTQGEQPCVDIDFAPGETGWLYQQQELHNRRAPGNTCLSALLTMSQLGEAASNDSKGCGGLMRVAPVGLFAWRLRREQSPRDVFRLGTDLAALTHGHPTGALTGGVLAVLIMALTDGASLADALSAAVAILRAEPDHEETLRAIESARQLAASGLPHPEAIARLGEGWVAEEALAIAVYCALVARTFRHGVILAVNHDGDSDSTGAIAGNLLGATHGVKAIPAGWLEALELRDVITELAEDLYDFKDWQIGEYSGNEALGARIWRKYPGF